MYGWEDQDMKTSLNQAHVHIPLGTEGLLPIAVLGLSF